MTVRYSPVECTLHFAEELCSPVVNQCVPAEYLDIPVAGQYISVKNIDDPALDHRVAAEYLDAPVIGRCVFVKDVDDSILNLCVPVEYLDCLVFTRWKACLIISALV
ncbi:MAG TPA: hypothetical protein PLJ60_14260 [Chryseolinea sp.]|nr:hypothetical protein [Chryseolinea sp.]HPM31496.1 hypothetical protein [Chryseolinea sp.]